MTITVFNTLLIIFSTITGFITEGFKKLLDGEKVSYSSNILAFIIACLVGISGTGVYYVFSSIEFNATNIVCMGLMGLATSIGAMIGYDKVIQTVEQIKNKI